MEIEKLIGNTPLINIDGIWCKCEFMNLTGSIKDRIAYEMLSHVDITKYDNVLEITSGNTGISISALVSWFGLRASIICPQSTSIHKIKLMDLYGAEILCIDGNIKDCKKHAKLMLKNKYNKKLYFLNQFENQYNLIAQQKMAFECVMQLSKQSYDDKIDAIIVGIGTGGTLAGLYKMFPNAIFYTWICDKPIEGTSDGVKLPLKPKQCNLIEIPIKYNDVIKTQKYLARKGFFVGLSSAANFHVAQYIKYGMTGSPRHNILTIFVDDGKRYLE